MLTDVAQIRASLLTLQTYTLLLENLRRDLNPGNALEEILVEKIAMAPGLIDVANGGGDSLESRLSAFA